MSKILTIHRIKKCYRVDLCSVLPLKVVFIHTTTTLLSSDLFGMASSRRNDYSSGSRTLQSVHVYMCGGNRCGSDRSFLLLNKIKNFLNLRLIF